MIEDSVVKLNMKKALLKGMLLDKATYTCMVTLYDIQEERLLMKIEEYELMKISLDAIYECEIYQKEGSLLCEGIVKERYQNEDGNMISFMIQKGFYEKPND